MEGILFSLLAWMPAVLSLFSQTSSNLMILEVTPCLMILNVDYFDRSAVSVAWGLLCELKKIKVFFILPLKHNHQWRWRAAPRKFISYLFWCTCVVWVPSEIWHLRYGGVDLSCSTVQLLQCRMNFLALYISNLQNSNFANSKFTNSNFLNSNFTN